ncbi:hypothetical protein [Aquabacterium sp.]|uniref:hypothetical protein n=1 Tax=Aquabacterium sp. TaxID=1872578 RepID=UPI0037844632
MASPLRVAALTCLLATALVGHAQPPDAALTVESCVSKDRLQLAAPDPWVMLAEDEALTVFEQMMQRYPVLQRDGLVPSRIALWRRPDSGAWLYVTLLEDPSRSGEMCFTATVVARPLAITASLLRKYFDVATAAR